MRFVIVTGMSGAGKTTALRTFEDFGYFCVDNLPVQLIENFTEIVADKSFDHDKIALGIDARNGVALDELSDVLRKLKMNKFNYEIMFLDANDQALLKRYKETRREHPLSPKGMVEDGISLERKKIKFLRETADYVIDTSMLLSRELKHEIESIYQKDKIYNNMVINIMSFGYKFGIPQEADYVMDARFLPNPYYDTELRPKTGNDKEIQEYVMSDGKGEKFLDMIVQLVDFTVPELIEKDGLHRLVIAIGCTGGRHRSVTIANLLGEKLRELPYSIHIYHRDIANDKYVKGEV